MSDSFFKDLPFVKVTEGRYPETRTAKPGAIAEGSFWTLYDRSGALIVEYVSGEIAGRAKSVEVTAEEADRLKSGDDQPAIEIINAHGGG